MEHTNEFDTFDTTDVIETDVLVIGGGSSGTYTAVRLHDKGKKVLIIEKQSTLGGHAKTYTDPSTGQTVDLGVIVFSQSKTVTDYFSRFDVPLVPIPSVRPDVTYVDFSTGKISDFEPPKAEAVGQAVASYVAQLQKYPVIQECFGLTYPVPPDLLLPFGEFVAKHGLEAMVPHVFLSNQGYVPLLEISTLYLLKYFNLEQVGSWQNGYLMTARQNVQELYQKAMGFLGSENVLLDSVVIAMDRSNPGSVKVIVNTPSGRKLVVAKKIVSTVPPLLQSLSGYDLSDEETSLFSQFRANGYYTALLKNTGIGKMLINSAVDQPYHVPKLPGIYSIRTDQGFAHVYYGSPEAMSEDDVKADIIAHIRRFQKVNGIQTDGEPEWVAFANNAPFNLMVSNEVIQDGFYEKLAALQGKRNTFYNGAAFHTQDSSVLWRFTDDCILPMLLGSL